jgi:hypothetical protein
MSCAVTRLFKLEHGSIFFFATLVALGFVKFGSRFSSKENPRAPFDLDPLADLTVGAVARRLAVRSQ